MATPISHIDWISIDERLPDETGDYLVWIDNSNVAGICSGSSYDSYYIFDDSDPVWEFHNDDNITHWAKFHRRKANE